MSGSSTASPQRITMSLDEWSLSLFVTRQEHLHFAPLLEQEFAPCTWIWVSLILLWIASSCKASYVAGHQKDSRLLLAPPVYHVMDNLKLSIHKSLSFTDWNATSTLDYFGSVCSPEFTVSSWSDFSPLMHLSVDDNSTDSYVSPNCLRLTIKASKTAPFQKGCSLFNVMYHPPLFVLSTLTASTYLIQIEIYIQRSAQFVSIITHWFVPGALQLKISAAKVHLPVISANRA